MVYQPIFELPSAFFLKKSPRKNIHMKVSLVCMKKNLEAEIILTHFDTERQKATRKWPLIENLMNGSGRPILLAVTRPTID